MDDFTYLGFHYGNAILRLAEKYSDMQATCLEVIQNAIDASAKKISFVLDKRARTIVVTDDGTGVSTDDMNKKLQSLAEEGRKDRNQLGRFSIGFMAFIGKSDEMNFTSHSRTEGGPYRTWLFVNNDIVKSREPPAIPITTRTDLKHCDDKSSSRGRTTVPWSTQVRIVNYTSDRALSRMGSPEEFGQAILQHYAIKMREKQVVVHLRFIEEDGTAREHRVVSTKAYKGKYLGEYVVDDLDAGKVRFRMYLSQPGTKGTVVVGEDGTPFRFNISYLMNGSADWIKDEVAKALMSGVFEGEITAEKVTLSATRKAFLHDDARVGFLAMMEKWYDSVGSEHLKAGSAERKETRYRNIGSKSIEALQGLLEHSAFKDICQVLQGTLTTKVNGGLHFPGIGPVENPPISPRKPHHKPDRDKEPPKEDDSEQSDDGGGDRKKRKKPGPSERALRFDHKIFEGSSRVYELDLKEGVLWFNTNHPLFAESESTDRKLTQFHITVAIAALQVLAYPEEVQDDYWDVLFEFLKVMIPTFHNTPAFKH